MTNGIKPWLWGPHSALGVRTAILTFAIDQTHKWWMLLIYHIKDKGRVRVTPFLDLIFVLNQGVSYGLLTQDDHFGQWLLAGFAFVAALLLAVWLARATGNRLLAMGLGLIMGGALANATDRLVLGGVADFFSLHAFGYYWYVFNIADTAIVAGVAALLYESLIPSRKAASKSS